MRRFLLPAALLAGALSSPAWADITARFDGNDGPALSVAIASNGGVRAVIAPAGAPEDQMLLIERQGVTYISAVDAQGRFVARQDDMVAIANQVVRSAMPEAARNAIHQVADTRLQISEVGTETIAGHQGRVYRIIMASADAGAAASPSGGGGGGGQDAEAAAPPPPFEVVICDDPELAPIGRELASLFDTSSSVIEATFGNMPAAVAQVRALLAHGTPIRIGDQLRLADVSDSPIPTSAFALPGPVLTRAQVAARAPH